MDGPAPERAAPVPGKRESGRPGLGPDEGEGPLAEDEMDDYSAHSA